MSCHTPHTTNAPELGGNTTASVMNVRWGDARQTVGGTQLPTNVATWSGSTKVCHSWANTYNGITTGDEALKSGWIAAPQDVKR